MVEIIQFDTDEQLAIETLVVEMFNSGLDDQLEDMKEWVKRLRQTNTFTMRKDPKIEQKLNKLFVKKIEGLTHKPIALVESPINLRVSHPIAPEKYLSREFPTDQLHCDPWYGEPENSTNLLYFVYANDKSSSVDFFTADESSVQRLRDFRGRYRDFDWKGINLTQFSPRLRQGQCAVFDAFTPHCTNRKDCEDIRISIDFRFVFQDAMTLAELPSKVKNKYKRIREASLHD